MTRFVRKMSVQHRGVRTYTIGIPAELRDIFTTTDVVIEILPTGDGISVRPAKIEVTPV